MLEENTDGIELDLVSLFRILAGKAWLILLSGLVAGLVLLGYARLFMIPQYRTNALFCVNNPNGGAYSSSQLQAAHFLADTYMVILESRSVLDAVSEKTGLPYTREELEKMVSSTAVNDTEVFKVIVTCPDPNHGAAIANAIVEVLPEKIAAALPGSAMYVVDEAVVDDRPVSPNYGRMAVLGCLLGILLSAAAVVVVAMLDDSIRSDEYLQRTYGEIPLLAVIPDGGSYRSTYTSFQQEKQGGKRHER